MTSATDMKMKWHLRWSGSDRHMDETRQDQERFTSTT